VRRDPPATNREKEILAMNGREHRWFMLVTAVGPLIAVVCAMVLLWQRMFSWVDLGVLVAMYSICILGISMGFHRLLAHNSFVAPKPLRIALAVMGTMAGQGPPLIWTAHHRKHHRLADREGDPHSPHLESEPGFAGVLKGLWHSHIGWLFDIGLTSDPMRYCPDLVRERSLRWISAHFLTIVAAGVLLPGIVGAAITGTVSGGLTAMLWGGLVRIFLVNHVTYAVNSVGHYFGRRRFDTIDKSRNVGLWLAIPSFGEAWHNNHHAFPRAANHGQRWYEVDITAGLIVVMEKLGIVSKVVRIDPERLALRETGVRRVDAARGQTTSAKLVTDPAPPLANRTDTDRLTLTDVE
jgi:stearoyl-CoA desaturase (Delta-9 desaturase)